MTVAMSAGLYATEYRHTHIPFANPALPFIRLRMAQILTRYEALQAVRNHFDTQQEMADFFGVSQPTVWRWLNQSKQLPAEHVLRAEAETGVSRHDLRPDIYPVEPAPSLSRVSAADQRAGARFVGTDRRAGHGKSRTLLHAGIGQ